MCCVLDKIIVSGGAGREFGVRNKLAVYLIREKLSDPLYEEDLGEEAIEFLYWCPRR